MSINKYNHLKIDESIYTPFRHWGALTLADLSIDRAAIFLNLGYHGNIPDEQIKSTIENIIDYANNICCPKAGYNIFAGKLIDKDIIEINNVPIKTGRVIAKYYSHATHFATFVATAGIEFDLYLHQLRSEGNIVNEFLADAVGSEIAEATVRFVADKISEEATLNDLSVTHSYSPGYCSWHVREQQTLFSLLPNKPCGIILNESCLMYPVKSVSGMVGLGETIELAPYACDICGLQTCYKRKETNTQTYKEG